MNDVDVLIVGAGISGIGVAYYLQRDHPGRSYAILEARGASGGTWDLFRYPGARSDSDLYTFGYEFWPWRSPDPIADAGSILAYLRDTAARYGIDRQIRYRVKVVAASWASDDARWTVTTENTETGEQDTISCRWLLAAAGYYRYDEGYTPQFAGRDRFAGTVVHPQHWPGDLDYDGKRVLVIGSGSTAVTLIPALAQGAGHVTMLQRTPGYVLPVPSHNKLNARLRPLIGEERAFAVTRWRYTARQVVLWRACRRYPGVARRLLRRLNAKLLPEGYPVDEHFNPPYAPWDQRMCIAVDGDLFRVISDGRASVVTGHIETFTEAGVLLSDGRELAADIIVTATGMNVQALGGIALTVDGTPVQVADTFVYQGMMLSGVPNFVFVFGYTNASWTLKVRLVGEYLTRLLSHMDANGYTTVTPVADPSMPATPFTSTFNPGYLKRAFDRLPRQGNRPPWQIAPTHTADAKMVRRGPVNDPELSFS